MKIRDILAEKHSPEVKTIHPTGSVLEAARRMTSHHIGSLVVTADGGKPIGIVTERDVMRALVEGRGNVADIRVATIMTRSLICCTPSEDAGSVLMQMKTHGVRHLPVVDGEEIAGIISMRELTRVYEELQQQANTDALTGLPNRRRFMETLADEFDRFRRYGRPLSLAMIDIDRFKQINDGHGHGAGDKVLCRLAKLMVQEFRTIDRIGRIGGEEFAVVFPETDSEKAEIACARLLQAARASVVPSRNVQIHFTVSIGIAGANDECRKSDDLLRRADELMYAAKSEGRNRVKTRDGGAPCALAAAAGNADSEAGTRHEFS
jgi:diguanylate cyclase (GGDEF)-like protein